MTDLVGAAITCRPSACDDAELADALHPFAAMPDSLVDAAHDGMADRRHPGEGEDVSLQALQAVGAIVEPIEGRRHPHGHDNPGGSTEEQPLREALAHLPDREARAGDLFEEPLEQRRHIAEPEWIDEDEVLGPADHL